MDLNAIYDNVCKFLGDTLTYLVENTDVIAFAIIALIALVAALVFVCVAATYYFLEAEFIGVIQLIVYVGAITMLFAFSIMLTRRTIMTGGDKDE